MSPKKKSAKVAKPRKSSKKGNNVAKKSSPKSPNANRISKKRKTKNKGHDDATDGEVAKFRMFTKLPPEIRSMIWQLYLPGPRNVGIALYSDPVRWMKPTRRVPGQPELDIILQTPKPWDLYVVAPRPPKLLSICKESRAEVQRTYEQIVGPQWPKGHPWHSLASKPKGYVNWKLDRICFIGTKSLFFSTESVMEAFMFLLARKEIRRIAVESSWGFEFLRPLVENSTTIQKIDLFITINDHSFSNGKFSENKERSFLATEFVDLQVLIERQPSFYKHLDYPLSYSAMKKQELVNSIQEWGGVVGERGSSKESLGGKGLEINLVTQKVDGYYY